MHKIVFFYFYSRLSPLRIVCALTIEMSLALWLVLGRNVAKSFASVSVLKSFQYLLGRLQLPRLSGAPVNQVTRHSPFQHHQNLEFLGGYFIVEIY